MWKFPRKKNFREVSAFSCAIVRVNGYFHFSLDNVRSKSRAVSYREYVNLIFFVIFGLYMSLKSSNVNVGTRNSLIFEMGLTVLLQLTVFMPTVFRIFNFIVRHRHVAIVESIEWIDGRLAEMGIEINHSKHFMAALTITLSYFGSLYFTLLLDEFLYLRYLPSIKLDYLEGIFAAINIAAYLSYQITHMLLIVTIYLRLKYLNRAIARAEISKQNHNVDTIRSLRKIHLRLCETMSAINACYALNLLNFFFQFTFFIIFFFFGLIHFVIAAEVEFEEVIFSIIVFGYVQFFFWFCVWVILHSSLLGNEVDNLEHTVMSQVMFTKDRKCMKHFHNFHMQVQHQDTKVSSGLFAIDWKFLFGIFNAAFSYLIILIQFDIA